MVGGQQFVVGRGQESSPGLLFGSHGAVPGGRGPDPDGGGKRLGLADRVAQDQRGGTSGLGPEHPRQRVADTVAVVLGIALPVSGDVSGVSDRQCVDVRRRAKGVDDLERRSLLSLDAHRVHTVDQGDGRVIRRQFAGELQAVIEIAVDLDDLGAVHDGLGELSHRDLALRDQHRAGDTGPRRIGGGRSRGVSGRCAQHGLLPAGDGLGHGHRHTAVLERPGRVESLDLDMHRASGLFRQSRCRNQRRATLQ